MLIVRVELHSARDGSVTEIARAEICNDGTSRERQSGNYQCRTLKGRTARQLEDRVVQRKGTVKDYPRLALHVWNLVADALRAMGYGRAKT